RREFLRLAAGSALAVTATGIAGCGGGNGGGGGNNNGGGGGGGGGTVDLAASSRAITDFVNTVQNQPRAARMQQIADYLKTRKELSASGVNESGVWGVYSDGVPLMILDNRDPDELPPNLRSTPVLPIRRGAEAPTPLRARLINAMGSVFVNEVPIVS